MTRESIKERRIMDLSLRSFSASIEYSWNEKWRDYGYTNSEKTDLILNNLKLGMELRDDVMKMVIDKLLSLNKDDDNISLDINEFKESILLKKSKSPMEKKTIESLSY
ncbi:hypothetical protein [Paenisporosarcina sp. TG20]|uniref:hypothetical protein n=1 Tax=Paenisporosarcina sp. TG20 TaxID=1211706 RepID=UPI00036B2CF7|nr:hypothetical protein [Paenisporosarcina sp. TG20]